jgi:hypothetical protein
MRTSTFPLTDRALGGKLKGLLTGWRGEGLSLEEITFRLRSEYDVTVSAATVHRWCASLNIEKPDPAPSESSETGR